MPELKDLYQKGDWKTEKHVPGIDAPEKVKSGEFFKVTVSVGKEIAHPNTTAHHIAWIKLYFHPEGSKFPYEIGKADFSAHGASVDGADTSTVYTHHEATISFKTEKPGVLYAASFCNIHGLWENSRELAVD